MCDGRVISHLGLCQWQKREAIYATKQMMIQDWISNCVTAISNIKTHEFVIQSCEQSPHLVNSSHIL